MSVEPTPPAGSSQGLRVVLKIGTSSLINSDTGCVQIGVLARLCEVTQRLRRELNAEVVIVSSGAVGTGCMRLDLKSRPSGLAAKQAMAAVGQVSLMRTYDDLFSQVRLVCAQVLLTYDCYFERRQYLNAVDTLTQLLKLGAVPIVNENDTVSTDELKFGDNDSLSAYVANMVGASLLFLITDVDALYSADPRIDPSATPMRVCDERVLTEMRDEDARSHAAGSQWGTGGMATKLKAAEHALFCGVDTFLLSANDLDQIPDVITKLSVTRNECKSDSEAADSLRKSLPFGTLFMSSEDRSRRVSKIKSAKKRWLLGLRPQGRIHVDRGACRVLCERRMSLLPVGITGVDGSFNDGDVVSICSESREFARGRANYNSEEMSMIKGKKSSEIEKGKILTLFHTRFAVDRESLIILRKPVGTVDDETSDGGALVRCSSVSSLASDSSASQHQMDDSTLASSVIES